MARTRSRNRWFRRHGNKTYHHENRPMHDQFWQEIPVAVNDKGKVVSLKEAHVVCVDSEYKCLNKGCSIKEVHRVIHDRKPAKKVFGK